jgi:O-antigen ligase
VGEKCLESIIIFGMFSIRSMYNSSLQLLLVIFPLSTAWIYFEPSIGGVKWQYGTLLWYVSEAILAVCVISCCLHLYTNHIRGKQIQFCWTKERLFVLSLAGFCAYLYGRSFFTVYPDIALQQSVHVPEAVLFFFCILLSPLENKVLIRALVCGAVFQAIFGLSQFFLQATWSSTLLGTSVHMASEAGSSVVVTESERWLRAYGTLSHPNVFGGYIAAVLLLFLYSFQFSVSKQISDFKFLVFKYFIIVLLTAGIFVSFSRSAWIALFMGLFVYVFLSIRKKVSTFYILNSTLSIIVPFLLLSILFAPLMFTRLGATSVNEQQSITERVSGNREAIELVQDNPVFGVGPGHYTVALMQKDSSRPVWEYQPVHNVALLVFSEVGVVGIFLLCLIAYLFFKTFQMQFVDLLIVIPFIPLFLFDHYVWSSLVGLLLIAVFVGLDMRICKREENRK